jgi:glucose/arabinose dehydrogenase
MKLAKAVLLFGLMAAAVTASVVSTVALAQVNAGDQKNDTNLPFNMTTVATFTYPWRIAFLPDGRMLVTEKVGPVWLVTPQGQKTIIGGTPAVWWQGQSGMLGVYVSPTYATDQNIYLTYSEPGDYGGGLALSRARLNAGGARGASLQGSQVLWRQVPKGRGGQESLLPPMANRCSLRWAIVSVSRPRRIPTSRSARSCI